MIENFNNIYLFLLFIFACIFTPGFYAAAQLWESKKVLERYGIDESATLIARFAACWPTVTAGAARFTKVRRALYIVRLAVDAVAVRRKNWLG